MKKIRFLLFTLLALFYVTNANALIVGNRFERDGITYEVTAMEEAHDGLPKRFNVKFVSSKMSGVVNIRLISTNSMLRLLTTTVQCQMRLLLLFRLL